MPCLLQFNLWKSVEKSGTCAWSVNKFWQQSDWRGQRTPANCFQDQWSGENLCSGFSGFYDMSRLCHHALPGTTSAGFPLTLPAQACVRFILRRYMPIFLINLQYFLGRTLFSIIQNEIKWGRLKNAISVTLLSRLRLLSTPIPPGFPKCLFHRLRNGLLLVTFRSLLSSLT